MIKLNPDLNVYGEDIPIWERGQEGGRTRPINREILFTNLVEVKSVFDKHEIKFCLSHGTMLGVWRDKDFIAWDDDIDIALFTEDKHKFPKATEELRDLGFFIPPNNPDPKAVADPKKECPFYDFVAIKDGEKIEGWFFDKVGDYYIYDFPRCGNDLKHHCYYYDKFDTLEWKGYIWNTPREVPDYLVMMYGSSWSKPDPNKKYNNQKFDSNGNCITDVS